MPGTHTSSPVTRRARLWNGTWIACPRCAFFASALFAEARFPREEGVDYIRTLIDRNRPHDCHYSPRDSAFNRPFITTIATRESSSRPSVYTWRPQCRSHDLLITSGNSSSDNSSLPLQLCRELIAAIGNDYRADDSDRVRSIFHWDHVPPTTIGRKILSFCEESAFMQHSWRRRQMKILNAPILFTIGLPFQENPPRVLGNVRDLLGRWTE